MATTVIAVISQKGGSGKTTTVVNLAVAARQDGKKVLVLDLDPQASATAWHKVRADKQPLVLATHQAGLAELRTTAETQGVDWLLIDTAAGTDQTAALAVEIADVVLIPCRPSVVDLRAIPNSIRLCRVQERKPLVVLTQIEPQGALADEARANLVGLGVTVLSGGLGRRAAFHHSMIDGRGVQEYEAAGKAAQELRTLYQTLCKHVSMSSSQHVVMSETR
jgi:chromosome partitioning protein